MCPADENLFLSQNNGTLSSSDDTLLNVSSCKWDDVNYISTKLHHFRLRTPSKPNFMLHAISTLPINQHSSKLLLEKQRVAYESVTVCASPVSSKNTSTDSNKRHEFPEPPWCSVSKPADSSVFLSSRSGFFQKGPSASDAFSTGTEAEKFTSLNNKKELSHPVEGTAVTKEVETTTFQPASGAFSLIPGSDKHQIQSRSEGAFTHQRKAHVNDDAKAAPILKIHDSASLEVNSETLSKPSSHLDCTSLTTASPLENNYPSKTSFVSSCTNKNWPVTSFYSDPPCASGITNLLGPLPHPYTSSSNSILTQYKQALQFQFTESELNDARDSKVGKDAVSSITENTSLVNFDPLISKHNNKHVLHPACSNHAFSSPHTFQGTQPLYSGTKPSSTFSFTPVYSNLRLPNEKSYDLCPQTHPASCNPLSHHSHPTLCNSKATCSGKLAHPNSPTECHMHSMLVHPSISLCHSSLVQPHTLDSSNHSNLPCSNALSTSNTRGPSFMPCCSTVTSNTLPSTLSLAFPTCSSSKQASFCASCPNATCKDKALSSLCNSTCVTCSTPMKSPAKESVTSLDACSHLHPVHSSSFPSYKTAISIPHGYPPLRHQHQHQHQHQHRLHLEMEHRFQGVELKDVIGRIATLAKDQYGCRFLQRVLENNNSVECECILKEVLPHLQDYMINPFGNYLCQKLLEYATASQTTAILKQVASNLIVISLNMHGTRAAQKLVDHVTLPEHIELLRTALAPYTVTLVKDLNGNHVIQKCLIRLRPHDAQFVFDAMLHHCVDVATHRHGCCVLQRCLDYANFEQKHALATEITQHCLFLIKDPFGNYVVQYVLEMGEVRYIDAIAMHLLGQVPHLSTQKFSSNVVEKCIRVASPEVRKQLVAELYSKKVLQPLLRDAFANYVVQTSIDHADTSQRALLMECLIPLMPLIRNTPYGRRIMNKLNINY